MVQELKKPTSSLVWRAGNRTKKRLESSSFLPPVIAWHWIAAGAYGKAWIQQSFPDPIFSASCSRDFLSRRWLCPMVLNRGIYPLRIYLIHFLTTLVILAWAASCGNEFHHVTKACELPHMCTSWGLMYDLCFGNPRKQSSWRCGSVLEVKERELSANQSNTSGFYCGFVCLFFNMLISLLLP